MTPKSEIKAPANPARPQPNWTKGTNHPMDTTTVMTNDNTAISAWLHAEQDYLHRLADTKAWLHAEWDHLCSRPTPAITDDMVADVRAARLAGIARYEAEQRDSRA